MLKFFIRFFILLSLNYLVITLSIEIDIEQFKDDLENINLRKFVNTNISNLIISSTVSVSTILLIYIFRPFIEIYLLHFQKIYFYLLINLISISTIYIVFRVYGYSRLYLLLYLLLSTFLLRLIDRFIK